MSYLQLEQASIKLESKYNYFIEENRLLSKLWTVQAGILLSYDRLILNAPICTIVFSLNRAQLLAPFAQKLSHELQNT